MTVFNSVTCCWVPGTLDSIRVTSDHQDEVWHIRDVARCYGRQAMDDLYLKGRFETHRPRREPLHSDSGLQTDQKI